MKKILLFLLFSFYAHAEALPSLEKETDERVLMLTVPKSGTNLLSKLIYLIFGQDPIPVGNFFSSEMGHAIARTSQRNYDRYLNLSFRNNPCIRSHFNFSAQAKKFIQKNPEHKVLLLVRDLRDVCVSTAHYRGDIEERLGRPLTTEEKLTWVITNGAGEDEDSIWNCAHHAREAISWTLQPNTLLIRFEDLCGPRGGSSLEAQKETISSVSQFFGVELTDEEIEFVSENLWGRSSGYKAWTFRKGRVGGWQDEFSPENLEMFNKKLGDQQQQLGYSS